MALRYRNINLGLDEDEISLKGKLSLLIDLPEDQIHAFKIVRRSIDARKKPRVLRVYTVEFICPDETALLSSDRLRSSIELVHATPDDLPVKISQPLAVVVVGMGPCGLFAAYRLAIAGAQVTLLERGDQVEQRVKRVQHFWQSGELDPESNVQFGEGGAGTFSDGKLSTRLNHPRIREVLKLMVDLGADPEILQSAKPHVGTDRLRKVLINFRHRLEQLGVQIHYRAEMTDFDSFRGSVSQVVVNQKQSHTCDAVIIAPGHSATGTFEMLLRKSVKMGPKPFAMGVRVEHPVDLINRIQYGISQHPKLPTADYALSYNDRKTGRGVYSFCMCPGGEVINASSESQGVVVNGMSNQRRNSEYSNSALVVSVRESDFFKESPLDGLYYQRFWEKKAFTVAGGNHFVPAQNLMGFLGQKGHGLSASCSPGITDTELYNVLPDFVAEGIKAALPQFDRKMKGFVSAEANLFGVETRTSSPVRVERNDLGESVSHPGLFPAGEGAGYAGGIMSAALDGLRAADAVLKKYEQQESL